MNNEQNQEGFPPEVHAILDHASSEDGVYSAKFVDGGIYLVLSKDPSQVIESYYWPEANASQRAMLRWLAANSK
jgi:hypothetical protein